MAAPGPPPRDAPWLLLGAALALAAVAAGCLGPGDAEPAPPFEVETVDDGTWNLTDHRGQTVVLDFMATTCHPCNEQSRHLAEASNETPEAAYLSLGVSPADNGSAMRDWQARHDATWPHAPSAGPVATDYGVVTIPTIVVVDGDGRIHWTSSGREVVDAATVAEKVAAAG